MSSSPIYFEPLAMERVWGGRRLEVLFGKSLPHGVPIGEIWELVDRVEAQSVVHEGPLRGTTLNDLWQKHREEVFGREYLTHPAARFPLLVKLLDARDRLSLQVHPPASLAPALGGEPKTEVWYFVRCSPGAQIYAGIPRGLDRSMFESRLRDGTVEDVLHTISVQSGDSIFIPSGRLHAIGEGNVIVEIQQNSDTTYRVFDWNRPGLDGEPRELHIEESLACIDFQDVEPTADRVASGDIANCDFFEVEKLNIVEPIQTAIPGRFSLFTVLEGDVECGDQTFPPGAFFILPANAADLSVTPKSESALILRTSLPLHSA
ncbi:MAG: type I phosphomannose isomerase catalytic subunit [Terrimicrobiaceae bacterium]